VANAPDATPLTEAESAQLFAALAGSRGIVLAVSGGSDSTALMYLFARWANGHHPRFLSSLVVTVDHGLRSAAADEARLVGRQAAALGLRHATLRWSGDKPSADMQNAARTARYRLLVDAAKTEGADTILTAHTIDDQAETFLIALARGSGVYGLAAMPASRIIDGVQLIRPLLSLPKARLIATLTAEGACWSEDPSNENTRFRRVLMRQAAPVLAELGLDTTILAGTAGRLARAAAALDTYADRLIAASIAVHPGGFLEVDLAVMAAEPEEVALRALARALKAMTGAAYTPRLDRLERFFAELTAAAATGSGARRTLAGVSALLPPVSSTLPKPKLWLFAEAGRSGFVEQDVLPGQTIDWDKRIRIELSAEATAPIKVRALGAGARRMLGPLAPNHVPGAALCTLPSFWYDDQLIGIGGIESGLDPAAERRFTVRALVGERLASALKLSLEGPAALATTVEPDACLASK
jgi:tRNA(Ile)-lysidine synthase